jgi:hypothetical protein
MLTYATEISSLNKLINKHTYGTYKKLKLSLRLIKHHGMETEGNLNSF